ncbi:MAG TPA: hypothetical protein VMP68_13260 [Candidatus Eisenbacteria bacterium]|nr:hypothetical protein [Candidatus Eisenbacteria bacterium]
MRILGGNTGIEKTGAILCALIFACALSPLAYGRQDSASKSTSPSAAKSSTTKSTTKHHSTKSTSASKSAHTSKTSSKKHSSKKKSTRSRGQQKIDPDRAQEIQQALVREHYLNADQASGGWNQASEEAMRKFQADHGWQSKTVPDSRALINLGLGPSKDHLLNPESAMTTVPDRPKSQPVPATSNSVTPAATPLPATSSPTPAAGDPPSPQ